MAPAFAILASDDTGAKVGRVMERYKALGLLYAAQGTGLGVPEGLGLVAFTIWGTQRPRASRYAM